MTQDNKLDKEAFIDWLLEKFNIPESSWIKFIKDARKALPDGDYFEKLKAFIEEKWDSPYRPPSDRWLNYHASRFKNLSGKGEKPLDPEIQKIRADKAFREANFEACQTAAKECFSVFESIWGKHLGHKRSTN